jgi:molybdenum cofactor biosynthesis enzyme MoaA
MALQLRFLLTSKCSARCAYCHNEGQSKAGNLLSLETIRQILQELADHGVIPDEIVLSGGEPTLHKEVGEIARLCQATGAHVSMDSHGGHPKLLAAALPYLDELKLHIDSFDAAKQQASMGIALDEVLTSIRLAQQYPLQLCTNHPLADAENTRHFVGRAREVGIDCKIIELFGNAEGCVPLDSMGWAGMGYRQQADGHWLHENSRHQLFTKRCGGEHNPEDALFIGADGIRRSLKGVIIGQAQQFSIRMVRGALQAA